MSTSLFRFENTKTTDDGELQTVDGYGHAGEELTQVHRVMPFGLSTNAPAGSHAIAIAGGGQRELVAALGLEHPDHRPKKTEAGGTVLYDANGQAISLIKNNLRIVGQQTITITAPTIVLDGTVKLGGADADKPASMKGTIDTGGNADQSNLSTKVLLK